MRYVLISLVVALAAVAVSCEKKAQVEPVEVPAPVDAGSDVVDTSEVPAEGQ